MQYKRLPHGGTRKLGSALIVALLLGPFLVMSGCTTNAVVQEVMVLNPHVLEFVGTDSLTVSITHTCTCPFKWTSSVRYLDSLEAKDSTWLVIDGSHTGDNTAIPIKILRSRLPAAPTDSLSAYVVIVSNEYGIDSLRVVVHR